MSLYNVIIHRIKVLIRSDFREKRNITKSVFFKHKMTFFYRISFSLIRYSFGLFQWKVLKVPSSYHGMNNGGCIQLHKSRLILLLFVLSMFKVHKAHIGI